MEDVNRCASNKDGRITVQRPSQDNFLSNNPDSEQIHYRFHRNQSLDPPPPHPITDQIKFLRTV
jgi:hypothetical protein